MEEGECRYTKATAVGGVRFECRQCIITKSIKNAIKTRAGYRNAAHRSKGNALLFFALPISSCFERVKNRSIVDVLVADPRIHDIR